MHGYNWPINCTRTRISLPENRHLHGPGYALCTRWRRQGILSPFRLRRAPHPKAYASSAAVAAAVAQTVPAFAAATAFPRQPETTIATTTMATLTAGSVADENHHQQQQHQQQQQLELEEEQGRGWPVNSHAGVPFPESASDVVGSHKNGFSRDHGAVSETEADHKEALAAIAAAEAAVDAASAGVCAPQAQ